MNARQFNRTKVQFNQYLIDTIDRTLDEVLGSGSSFEKQVVTYHYAKFRKDNPFKG